MCEERPKKFISCRTKSDRSRFDRVLAQTLGHTLNESVTVLLSENDAAVTVLICLPESDWFVGGGGGGGVGGNNFPLVLVSIALWEISVVADPVISSAC